ncbi:MAG TPA: hypothetical protein VNI58_10550 [Mariprofundaceae bacterium]|nr:hypothetical protein [Mariprofundaceae bacterium]
MHIDFEFAPWGMFYAALMYIVGNGIWTNHLVRRKQWLGWLMWSASAILVVLAGAVIELRLSGGSGLWADLSSADLEKYWIIATLYALLSFPGAASIIFRQDIAWTRLAVTAIAMLVFIPLGGQLHDPENNRLALSIGITLATCAIMWFWITLLDCEPEHRRKTVPVEEMSL